MTDESAEDEITVESEVEPEIEDIEVVPPLDEATEGDEVDAVNDSDFVWYNSTVSEEDLVPSETEDAIDNDNQFQHDQEKLARNEKIMK